MKRRFLLLLILFSLAVLAGCSTPVSTEPEVLQDKLPAEAVSLPEPRQLEPISVPAVVTEGRAPAEY
ncbi:hypothetical protein AALC17_03960 [Oscillospiraceae bacterium 38-13]